MLLNYTVPSAKFIVDVIVDRDMCANSVTSSMRGWTLCMRTRRREVWNFAVLRLISAVIGGVRSLTYYIRESGPFHPALRILY